LGAGFGVEDSKFEFRVHSLGFIEKGSKIKVEGSTL
jgi:hypothetical protein